MNGEWEITLEEGDKYLLLKKRDHDNVYALIRKPPYGNIDIKIIMLFEAKSDKEARLQIDKIKRVD